MTPNPLLPQPEPDAEAPPQVRRLPARHAALALACGGAVLAAGVALAVVAALGAAAWVAPLAAALGVLAAALPVVVWGTRLSRQTAPQPAVPMGPALSATGLAREAFLDAASREWARSRRHGTGAALLLVDVDRFDRLLESRGSAATDAVLGEMLRQTAPTLRGGDVLTRFTASQMAVFLAPADATGALDVAERIRERAEQIEVPFHPQRLRITVSVGVAHLRAAHLNLQSLVDDAQEAVTVAHEAGGNCVRAAPVESLRLRAPGTRSNDHRARPQ